MNSLTSLSITRTTAAFAAACGLVFSAIFAVSFLLAPVSAHAATELITNGDFGNGSDAADIADWEEKGNEGDTDSTIAKDPTTPENNDDSVSPAGGRFAKIGRFNPSQGQGGDGFICQEIDASGIENLTLEYYWRGDKDAESPSQSNTDYGYVEYRTNGSCESATQGWTNLASHVLDEDTSDPSDDTSWSSLQSIDLSALDGEDKILIRFRADVTSGIEHFRVDGVSIQGNEAIEVPSCDLTSEHPGFTTFDTFSLGDVDGQNDWSSTGPFDEEVVENIYGHESFGCQSLRLSNAITSGSFGDQTFAAPVSDTVGETGDVNHFGAQFDIASTQLDEQSGLAVSVSPDDGNGSRISYLGFADESGGIRVTFYDVVNNGPLPTTSSFNPTDLGLLDRSAPHTIKFVIDFVDGPGNDVVKIYIDGSLVHTGTTWEDYYRYDPEQNGNGNQLFPIDTLIFRAAGSAASGTEGEGYLFDNLSITTENIQPEPQLSTLNICKIIVDDQGNIIDGTPADAEFSIEVSGPNDFNAVATFTTPLSLEHNLVDDNGDAYDAYCYSYQVPAGQYLYEAEIINSGVAVWGPTYHDFFTEAPQSIEDFFELTVDGGDPDNDDADGVVNLGTNDERTIAIVNTLTGLNGNQCVPGQELLVNGGFESPTVVHNKKWNIFESGYTDLGWMVEWFGGSLTYNNEDRPEIANLELHGGVNNWNPAGGDQYAELDTDWVGPDGSLNGEPASVAISQTVFTEVGEIYTFSFDFSPRPNTGAAQNKVEVLVNGVVEYTAGPEAGSSNTSWTTHSFEFEAESFITTITLRDAGTPSDSLGSFVDNASLMCTPPEPEDPWCSFAGKVIDYSDPAYKNSGALVDSNRRDITAVETVASYQNIGGKEPSWSTDDFFSLGINGWLIYEFTEQVAVDQSGDDIAVYEITGGSSGQTQEKVEVWVSQNGSDFVYVDTITGDGSVDISGTGLDYVKYVKLIDDSSGVQGPGGDGYDVDAIVILDGSCADEPEPQYATVTLCKVDADQEPLSGWTLTLLGDEVDSFDVPANTHLGTNSTSLTGGTSYVALASGTWLNDRNPDNLVDAEYSVENDWEGNPIMDGFTGYGTSILELAIAGNDGDWGAYNSNHEYAQAFTPVADGAVNFSVLDTHYGDNSGSLQVAIHTGYAGVTDEQTGCVVFDEVPFGTYAASEILQDGWVQTDGPEGTVVIDSEEEIFTFENTELDTITAWKWNDADQDGVWDENENGIEGWDIVVKPETLEAVETLAVDSSDESGETTTTNLTDGRIYLVEVEGAYQYASNATRVADAGFYSTNSWSSYGEWGTDNPTQDQRTLNLIVDDVEISWGTYNDGHLYKALIEGNNAAVNFRVFERTSGHYNDNQGDIAVRIYDVTDYIYATDAEGAVEISVLPGEYQVVEMQREGWVQTAPTNPSYCHLDTTNNETTCAFGNYETEDAPETATLVATKIVCEAEEYLPNWGNGSYGPITADTATDWLAEGDNSDYCWLAPDWEFEWVLNSVSSSNPGDNSGAAGSPWTSTGLTANDGTVSVTVPAGERLWVREVLKDGYIEFTGQNTTQHESAELYCSTDVLNYDNWDFIDPVNKDETYYCVAWNAPIPGAPELTIVKETEQYDDIFYFGVSNEYYNFSALPNITTDDGYGELKLQLPGAGTFSVLELLDEDWVLDDVWCEYDSESELGTELYEQDGYQITVEDGDKVTCYFYNEVDCDQDDRFDEELGQCVPKYGESYFDLELTKEVSDTTPETNETIVYTISVSHTGDATGNIVVLDNLPSGVEYVSHTASNGNENYDAEDGEWTIVSLSGGTATLTITVKVTAESGTVENTAEIDSYQGNDEDLQNNSDSASFTVENIVVTTTSSNGGGTGGGGNPNFATFGFGGGIVAGASTEGQVLGESCGLYMDQFLRRGHSGNNPEQVQKLQQFLNKHGFGALDITGIFGVPTENAVKSFQQTYADQILTPWGLQEPTGLVYITTLRQINLIECPELSLQIPELVAWSLGQGSSVADSLTGNTTQNNTTQNEDDESEEEGNADQAASAGSAVKGQGFWDRVWGFFFRR